MMGMILAGGSGTRLWPFSRTMTPKQFLNLGNSHESLLQDTYRRLMKVTGEGKNYVVGSEAHEFEIKKQITGIDRKFPDDHFLLEPRSRNTAPAILWAMTQVPENQRDEPVIILPADHLIQDEESFTSVLKQAEALAKAGWLVTFGIKPDRPETGYGYIKAGEPLNIGYRVEKFEEKPPLEKAQQYTQSHAYTWNAGIFMATANTLLKEFQVHAPLMYSAFSKMLGNPNVTKDIINEVYDNVAADSLDYAILEKSHKVAVMPIDIKWSDLGSWESIYQVTQKDQAGNVIRGNVISTDTKNCLIFSTKKLVTSIGVENLIIVETDDALLVCDLRRSQDVKNLVNTLKAEDRYEYQFHTTVLRPWGSFTVVSETPYYKIKMLEILPGKRLSLQRHRHRSEHWVVVQGTADVMRADEKLLLLENQSVYIPQTVKHRLGNSGKIPVQIIEVQQGSYLGEDDIERFEDDFGRTPDEKNYKAK